MAGRGREGGFLKEAKWELVITSRGGAEGTALEILWNITQKPKEFLNQKCVDVFIKSINMITVFSLQLFFCHLKYYKSTFLCNYVAFLYWYFIWIALRVWKWVLILGWIILFKMMPWIREAALMVSWIVSDCNKPYIILWVVHFLVFSKRFCWKKKSLGNNYGIT